MVYVALVDDNNIVQRVEVVGLFEQAAATWGDGTWVILHPENNEYAAPGWVWDGESRCWPWNVNLATSTIWCAKEVWEAVPAEDLLVYCEVTGLNCLETSDDFVVLGGRTIIDSDLIALAEVLGL